MKISLKFSKKTIAVLSCMTLFLASCSEDGIQIKDVESQIEQSGAKINCFGNSDLHMRGLRFVGFATPANTMDIKYFIDPKMPQEWVKAIREASSIWTNATGSINMSQTLSRRNATVNYNYKAEPARYEKSPAGADYPDADGNFGVKIDINSNYVPDAVQNSSAAPVLTAKLRTYITVHELGHNFGYSHGNHLSFMPARFTTDEEKWAGMTRSDIDLIRSRFPNRDIIDPR